MTYNLLNAILYEICLILLNLKPSWKSNRIISLLMQHCFADWQEWKTDLTMKGVDVQTEKLKEDWQTQENEKVVEKFQKIFPESTVTTHDSKTGVVLIEHPPDGSKAQDLLGGAMEIRSPWSEGKF